MAAVVFGQVLDGAEAERVGLVYRCVTEDELLEHAQAFAAGAASAPRELAIVAKQTIADMAGVGTHDDAVDRELEPQLWTRATALVRASASRRCGRRSRASR